MKKTILYSLITTTFIISSVFTVAISRATSQTNNTQEHLDTGSTELAPDNIISDSKDEMVYIITDQSGTPTKSFIGNNLNTSTTEMPIKMQIKYVLDGHEISPKDLAGKSGHVKASFAFTSTKKYQDKLIPFLTITGLQLDTNKFSNIKLTNGKIIKESNKNTIITGYTLAGLNANLGTDFLPETFTLEADVKDFQIDTIYTIATNEIFAEIDTSKLNTINDLIGSINQLSSAFNQIIVGSSDLSNGLDSALAGAKKLASGSAELNTGAKKIANGATEINTGAKKLDAGAKELSNGLKRVVNINNKILDKINSVTTTIEERIELLNTIIAEIESDNPELANRLTEIVAQLTNYYNQAYSAVTSYTDGIKSLADGADQLSSGAHQLSVGTSELSQGANTLADGANALQNGADSLANGLDQLSAGGHKLNSGLNTFRQQGINRLVSFANHDLNSFLINFRATVSAAKNYHYYSNQNATSVKFVFKTPSI